MARRLTRALVCLSMLDVSLGDSQLLTVNTIQYSLFLTHGQEADQGFGVLVNAGCFPGRQSVADTVIVNTIKYSLFLTHGQEADQGFGVLVNAGRFPGRQSVAGS